MPVVSVTRLRVRSWFHMPSFLWHTFAAQRQLKRAPGFIRGALGNAPGRAFWTTSVWTDEASMKSFRDAAAHKKAMPRLLDICDEASLVRWTQAGDTIPAAAEMLRRLQTEGRVSKVRNPTPGQKAGQTVPDSQPPRLGAPFTA